MAAAILTAYELFNQFTAYGEEHFFTHALSAGSQFFAKILLPSAFGVIIVGGPFWLVAHFTGYHSWLTSISIGFVIPFIMAFRMHSDFLHGSSEALWSAIVNSTLFSLVGAVVALTIWRIAYRRPISMATPPC
ncbi:MAG: hypothetical protein COB08_009865 [Rhodobacteraceae bacterium]|nr:hypothetical protein [Paracoccaceae bacterium]